MKILNFNNGARLLRVLHNHCKKHRFKKIDYFFTYKNEYYVESFNFIDSYNRVIFSIKLSCLDNRAIIGKNNIRYFDKAAYIICNMTGKEKARYIKKLNNL